MKIRHKCGHVEEYNMLESSAKKAATSLKMTPDKVEKYIKRSIETTRCSKCEMRKGSK